MTLETNSGQPTPDSKGSEGLIHEQPKPDSMPYEDLIHHINRGKIKIPKFQRDFVWDTGRTAELLDSILKGYPIGTFILWETNERMSDIKNIGNFDLPETPDGSKVQYVLDGQQRITSLFAAYRGGKIRKASEKRETDYKDIVVNLDEDIGENDDPVITAEPRGERHVSLYDVLHFDYEKGEELIEKGFTKDEVKTINKYWKVFTNYSFSIILLRKDDIDSAIEVFTRINTGGKTLTLFEIMSAKTYDEAQDFDMQAKWESFMGELKDNNYDSIWNMVILNLLSLKLSKNKECKRRTILSLDKQEIIDNWSNAVSAIKDSIHFFRKTYRIPVCQLLPYDSLLVPFSYFFWMKGDAPNSEQRKYLEEFFWRMSLSHRYSSSTESTLAYDIKQRIDWILNNKRPDYKDIRVDLDSPEKLINTPFSAGNSYCKAILCLLAYGEPKDFRDNTEVTLDNSWLKVARSKNYHHFFPRKYLEKKGIGNDNSIVNITFISDHSNKQEIRTKAPSDYIGEFKRDNYDIEETLNSHFISLDGFGIDEDDYETFLSARSEQLYKELKERIGEGE